VEPAATTPVPDANDTTATPVGDRPRPIALATLPAIRKRGPRSWQPGGPMRLASDSQPVVDPVLLSGLAYRAGDAGRW